MRMARRIFLYCLITVLPALSQDRPQDRNQDRSQDRNQNRSQGPSARPSSQITRMTAGVRIMGDPPAVLRRIVQPVLHLTTGHPTIVGPITDRQRLVPTRATDDQGLNPTAPLRRPVPRNGRTGRHSGADHHIAGRPTPSVPTTGTLYVATMRTACATSIVHAVPFFESEVTSPSATSAISAPYRPPSTELCRRHHPAIEWATLTVTLSCMIR